MHIFATDIDLNRNTAKNFRIENGIALPTVGAGDGGLTFFHSGLSKFYGWNGTSWLDLGASGGGSSYTLPTATDTILGGVKIDNSTITIDGGGVISANFTNIVENISNPLDAYFGNRIKSIASTEGFYAVSSNNKDTGYLSNNTDNVGNAAISGFRATINNDAFGTGIYIGIANNGYYAPWIRNRGLITSKNLHLLVGDNTGEIIFSQGNTGTNSVIESQQDKVLRFNTDRTIVAPSLTTSIIDGEATGRVLVTKEWIAAQGFGVGAAPYLVYTAILSQTGTSAPVATVLQNTIGTITWSYTSVGRYTATSTGLFTASKTVVFVTMDAQSSGSNNIIKGNQQDINGVTVETMNSGVVTNGIIQKASIEIRVYP